MNNEKTLPKAWKKINETSEIAVASSGASKVLYIQDIGEKTEGNGYIDKITGKLYLCKTTNEDVEVTDNFVLATTLNNTSRLDQLPKIFDFEETLIGNIKFVQYQTPNSTTSKFEVTFECEKVLHVSVLPWNGGLELQTMSTNLSGKTLQVKTGSSGGCKIFAILLI